MRTFVGTSGYSYKEWKGNFYSSAMKSDEMLPWYAERLPTVEINNTFYRMPKRSVLENWASATPAHFRFAIKASRRITHMKRLNAESAEPSAGRSVAPSRSRQFAESAAYPCTANGVSVRPTGSTS